MCGNRFIAQVHVWMQAIARDTKGDVISPSLILLTSVMVLAYVSRSFLGLLVKAMLLL